MLVVETIAKIRRAFFVQGKAIKCDLPDLGVSRKVVRKVIRFAKQSTASVPQLPAASVPGYDASNPRD
jgi:hypothetical protein